jgi:hypothetical protein
MSSRRALCVTALAVAMVGCTLPQTTDAAGPGFSFTRSTTEPYAACGRPTAGHSECLAILVPSASPLTGSASPQLVGPLGANRPTAGSGVGGGYDPADLRSAYNLPTSSAGTGQTVAIVDAFDDPKAESDLGVYRSRYGLSACTTANGCFRKVNQTGGSTLPAANAGWAVEISLDLDMVSAACPNCHLLLVEASSNANSNLFASENEAVALGATEVTNSWAGPESAGESSDDSFFHHPGVPITASSGDNGFGVEYPASSPEVIAVGGTALTPASNARGWSETAWSGAGSGCSADEPKPAWQTDTSCAKRTTADTAADASPATPLSVADSYELPAEFSKPEAGWTLVGGTSASSPFIGGTMALANALTRSFPGAEALYREDAQNAAALNDVTSGSNTKAKEKSCGTYLCTAGPGYDGPTGLGTPNGAPEVQVAPEWISNAALPKVGVRVGVVSWGTLALKTVAGGSGEVTCDAIAGGTVWDPEGGGAGKGETQVFNTYECEQTGVCPAGTTVTVAPEALPWASSLSFSAGSIRSTAHGVKMKIACLDGEAEMSATNLVGSLAPIDTPGTSALHPGLLEFAAGSSAMEVEGSGGAVQYAVEGGIKLSGYQARELINTR